jgi:hypothetical protein
VVNLKVKLVVLLLLGLDVALEKMNHPNWSLRVVVLERCKGAIRPSPQYVPSALQWGG